MQVSRITLQSFGGTFVEKGQLGRKGLFVPFSQEDLEEHELLTGHDRLRPMSFEEQLDAAVMYGGNREEGLGVAEKLFQTQIADSQIQAAAKAAFADPELLLTLYQAGQRVENIEDRAKKAARKKIFGLLSRIFSAMLDMEPREDIVCALAGRKSTPTSVLGWIERFARNEATHNGYGHWTATRMLDGLGRRIASCKRPN